MRLNELIQNDSFEDIDDLTQLNNDCLSLVIEMEANGWIVRKKGEIIIQQKKLACELFEFLAEIFSALDEVRKHTKQEIVDAGIDEDGYEEYMQSSCTLYNMCLMLFGEFARERLPTVYFRARCVERNDEFSETMQSIEESRRRIHECMELLTGDSCEESLDERSLEDMLAELDDELSKDANQENGVLIDEKECSTPTSDYEDNATE